MLGVAAFALIALAQFNNGSNRLGVVAAICAFALGAAAAAGVRNTTRDLHSAVADSVRRGRAIGGGQPVAATRSPIPELDPVNAILDEMAEQQRVVRAQSEALAAGAYDSPVLDTPATGPLGEAMQGPIEDLRAKSEALRDSQAVTSSIMDNVSDAIIVLDNDGAVVASNAVSQVALELFGGSLDDAIPGWQELPIGDHDFSRVLADGTLTLTQVTTSRMMTATGAVTMLCWRDISGERAVQAQVAHVARTDIVTGLPNRQGLLAAHDRLAELGHSASVIHVDLAEFGKINQRHGFDEGDHVLQAISSRLRKVIRDHDTVARTNGDEFVLLLASQGDVVDALAHRILNRIAEPIELRDGTSVSISAHAGWSSGTVDGGYELLRRAAYALAEAKSEPGSVSSYSEEVAQRDENRRQWEEQLRRAIEQNEFVLFAQPIVDIFERRVLGVEIFLRWQHPSGRLIGPAEFMSIAEESDLITEIDRWVIETCVIEAGKSDPSVVFSLNVSSRFMSGTAMADFMMATLARSGLPAARLQVDVTETNVASDVAGVIESIRRLNGMGVKVALDDFGTGYSSLAHLLKLAVSTIKIDRRMVSMVTEPEGRGVVAAILAFARKRKLTVVAEGVESAEEVAELAELGCRYQQGYFHGHPAPLSEVLASLDSIPFNALDGDSNSDSDSEVIETSAVETTAAALDASSDIDDTPIESATA